MAVVDKRFINQLYKSFKTVGGYIISVIATIATILSIKYEDKLNVNFWIIILISCCLIFVMTLLDTSLYFFKESINKSPRIIKILSRGNDKIILTEYSELLQIQGLVTIFHFNDDFEDFIGYGEVINIQNDKNVQILLKKLTDETQYNDLNEIRKNMIIKPFVTTKTLEK